MDVPSHFVCEFGGEHDVGLNVPIWHLQSQNRLQSGSLRGMLEQCCKFREKLCMLGTVARDIGYSLSLSLVTLFVWSRKVLTYTGRRANKRTMTGRRHGKR